MSALPKLVLRADANARIGSGHLFRCLALALEWKKRGGAAEFVSRCENPAWAERVKAAGFALSEPGAADPPKTDGWLVVDGYHFDEKYLAAAREGAKTLVVDDFGHRPALHGHVLLNQNLGAERREYALDADTLPLLGPRFALLRPEFSKAPARAFSGRAKKVLISLGGSDPENFTAKAVAALPEGVEAVVVLGAAYAHPEPKRANVRCERNVADMPGLMAWADCAVLAGGTTAWEACFTGLPSVMLVLAENQKPGAAALNAAGAAKLAGTDLARDVEALVADSALREKLSSAARKLVDGRGASRVVDALLAVSAGSLDESAVVREISADDCLDVWRLANEPGVRANSFKKEPIPLDGHVSWFAAQLGRTDARYWALEAGGTLAAQVRYVRDQDGAAEVHFSVRGAFRGKGLGTLALARTSEQACKALKASRLRGVVIAPNPASERAFEKAGYARAGEKTLEGRRCLVFEKTCS